MCATERFRLVWILADLALSGLVTGDFGVDRAGPGVDAAGEGLYVGESLLAEPEGDVQRASSVVAHDYNWGIGVELSMGAGGDVSHGHEDRVGDASGLMLPGFADV